MLRMATPGGDWCMPLYRRGALGPFGPEEAARLTALAPVVERLVARCERIAMAEVGSRLEGIEDLGRAAFAIDWSGAVVCRNAAAEAIEGEDLWVAGRRLRAGDRVNAARIRGLVAAAVLQPGECDPVVLHRDGAPWIVIDALPVTRRTTEVFANARAVLVASPVATGGLPPLPLLRAAFGLTPAEARMAQELAAGQRLAQAAVAMGIGLETARSHLDALFDKTGCRRQATLAALLARVAGAVRH
jgi:DNA-binding CsgD family transcriptional regulator